MKTALKGALKEAMKARDKLKLETLRCVLSAIQYEEIRQGKDELSDEASAAVLKNEIKKRQETMQIAEQAQRQEMKAALLAEIAVLEAFLPRQLNAPEIEAILTKMKAENSALNLGAAMKQLKEGYAGQYDGKTASDIAKRILG
jgi:uncharacterized protein